MDRKKFPAFSTVALVRSGTEGEEVWGAVGVPVNPRGV